MNRKVFERKLRQCESLAAAEPPPRRYWVGYVQGLKDEKAEAAEKTEFANPGEATGYRDGREWVKESGKVGRPPLAEQITDLGPVRVPTPMAKDLETLAGQLGISVAETRRKAYSALIRDHRLFILKVREVSRPLA